jgi:hypothetical protein
MPSTPHVLDSSIKAGVTLTPASGTAKHTYTDYNLFWVDAAYPSKKRKSILANVPYKNGAYDFSRISGSQYYERVEVEYKFAQVYDTATAMRSAHSTFEAACWDFQGTITDDYGKTFAEAVCEAFDAVVLPQSNTLQITVKFSANEVN